MTPRSPLGYLHVILLTVGVYALMACSEADQLSALEDRVDSIQRDLVASMGLVASSPATREGGSAGQSDTEKREVTGAAASPESGQREDIQAELQSLREATEQLASDLAGIRAAVASRAQVSPTQDSGNEGDLAAVAASVEGLAARVADLEESIRSGSGGSRKPVADRIGNLWFPYLEWKLHNASYDGNPFDLVASVTFVHSTGGDRHETGMFYDGDNTWRFRFTGTRIGIWTFATQSPDPELNGHSGTVRIDPPLNPHQHGFITAMDGKWAWMGTNEAFVPQLVMYGHPPSYVGKPAVIDGDIQTFLVEHGFSGFHTSVRCRWFDITTEFCNEVESPNPNPDPRTFRALELLITKVHAAGGMVHIWAWGDEARNQTQVRFGINGDVDQRLQRYIAMRLGPIPGWSMGYGFDLDEWVTVHQLHVWHAFMQEEIGWNHFFGGRPSGPNSGDDHGPYVEWNSPMSYASFEHHEPVYDTYAAASRAANGKPVMSEDRFRIQRDAGASKHYTMLQTRRGLWHSAMAGGIANIWGNVGDDSRVASETYPDPEVIRTYATFFGNRYTADLSRANSLTNGVALKLSGSQHYIVYKEDAREIRIDLTQMSGPQPLVAVDTARPYEEIVVGLFEPASHTWMAPYVSDWALAIGHFN
jgi:hypothetical protein